MFGGLSDGYGAVETRIGASVAGSAAELFDAENEGILVAIGEDLVDDLVLAGGCAFVPEFLARPGVVDRLSEFEGFCKGFGGHVGEHEDLTGFVILRDSGDKPVLIEFWGEGEALFEFLLGAGGGEAHASGEGT